jgi:hypothetical protein
MPRKEFEAFTRLDASDVNTFLMDQSVMSFAGTAARGSAIATPVEGMLTYLEDSDEYQSYNGTSYVTVADGSGWTTFVPTWQNLTVGNGVYNYAKFKIIGKTVSVALRFTFGSTSEITGDLQINLPTAIRRIDVNTPGNLSGNFADGTTIYPCVVSPSATTRERFLLRAMNTAGTYAVRAGTTSTIPFTWAANDEIDFSAIYEVA